MPCSARYSGVAHNIWQIFNNCFPMRPGESRVIFKPEMHAQTVFVEALQESCDQLIAENLSCQITLRDDGFRQVSFGELPPYPCGGTHVTSLKHIHKIQIQTIKEKKGKLSVQYDIVMPT